MTQFEKTFGNGRSLTYRLEDYWDGVSGEGDLGYQWTDKPHRLVFDLIAGMLDAQAEIARLKAERDECRVRAEKAEAALIYCADWLAYRGTGPGIDLALLKIRDALAGKE